MAATPHHTKKHSDGAKAPVMGSLKGAYAEDADALFFLQRYQAGLSDLQNSLGGQFQAVRALLAKTQGQLIFSGVGKSGYIAQKLASSFSSVGRSARFLHPAEGAHGEFGAIRPEDIIFLLSNSGQSDELFPLARYAKDRGNVCVTMTAHTDSTLGKISTHTVPLPVVQEGCSFGASPTVSSAMMLVLGDILMACLAKDVGVSAQAHASFHPAGQIGLDGQSVADVMHFGDALPLAKPDQKLSEALMVMSEKRLGCVLIVTAQGRVRGILTDGDIRRLILDEASPGSQSNQSGKVFDLLVGEVMHRAPVSVDVSSSVGEVKSLMLEKRINHVCITDDAQNLQGLAHWMNLVSDQACS